MSIDVRVEGDIAPIRRHMSETERKVIPKAQSMALNKTGSKLRTATVRGASRRTGIKQKILRPRINFKGRLRATPRRLAATMIVNARPVPVHQLGKPKQTKRGVNIGRQHKFPGAFIPRDGGPVFRREGPSRLPIERIDIPILDDAQSAAQSAMRDVAQREYPIELERAINQQLRKIRNS